MQKDNENVKEMKQYKSLDLAKFVCAVLIIILHTAPFSSYSSALSFGFRNIVTVIAVPFFFVTSGFLAFKKMDTLPSDFKKQYIRHYLMRLLVMYLVWSAVYFPFVIIRWVQKGFSFDLVLEYVKDFFLEGSYSTIWFLPALLVATLLVYLLHKKLSYKMIFIIACIIYVFTLGGSSYYGLVTKIPAFEAVYNLYYTVFDSIKNGVCFGLIFVSMGAMLAEREERITEKPSFAKDIILASLFAVLLAAEEFLVAYMRWNDRGVDTVIMLVPFTFFFVKFLLQFHLNISDRVCVTMRKLSILMFLTQRIPLSIIEMLMQDTVIYTNSLLYFAVVLASTMLISFGIVKASEKIKILKRIY